MSFADFSLPLWVYMGIVIVIQVAGMCLPLMELTKSKNYEEVCMTVVKRGERAVYSKMTTAERILDGVEDGGDTCSLINTVEIGMTEIRVFRKNSVNELLFSSGCLLQNGLKHKIIPSNKTVSVIKCQVDSMNNCSQPYLPDFPILLENNYSTPYYNFQSNTLQLHLHYKNVFASVELSSGSGYQISSVVDIKCSSVLIDPYSGKELMSISSEMSAMTADNSKSVLIIVLTCGMFVSLFVLILIHQMTKILKSLSYNMHEALEKTFLNVDCIPLSSSHIISECSEMASSLHSLAVKLERFKSYVPQALLLESSLTRKKSASQGGINEVSSSTGDSPKVIENVMPTESQSVCCEIIVKTEADVDLPNSTRKRSSEKANTLKLDESIEIDLLKRKQSFRAPVSLASFRQLRPVTHGNVMVRTRKATVLLFQARLLQCNTVFVDKHVDLSAAFVRLVLNVIRPFEGVVLTLGPSSILVSWNCHKSIPQHSLQACQAALDITAQIPGVFGNLTKKIDWSCGIASGSAFVGQSGTVDQKTALVAGEPVTLAGVLARLAIQIGARITVNEGVFDRVQTQLDLRLVDSVNVPSETLRKRRMSHSFDGDIYESETSDDTNSLDEISCSIATVLVYELVGVRGSLIESSPELYIEGFSHFRAHHFDRCIKKFASYLESNPETYQAYRIMQVASHLRKELRRSPGSVLFPKPLYRREIGWDNLESDFENLPPLNNLQEVPPPFIVNKQARVDQETDTKSLSCVSRNTLGLSTAVKLRRDIDAARNEISKMVAQSRVHTKNAAASTYSGGDGDLNRTPSASSSRSLGMNSSASRTSLLTVEEPPKTEPSKRDRWMTTKSAFDTQQNPDCAGPPIEVRDRVGNSWWRSNRLIGKGACGEVWMALAEDGGMLAMKTIKIGDIPTQQKATRNRTNTSTKRYNNEIEDVALEVSLLSGLRHENIVSYLGSVISGRYIFICMEYMSGGSLAALLDQFGTLPVSSTVRYLKDILRGLKFLHDMNIVHCDIKPHNVLLLTDGQCKLSDFGASQTLFRLAAKGLVQGTPQFMAPEAAAGSAGKASDIWGVYFNVIIKHK